MRPTARMWELSWAKRSPFSSVGSSSASFSPYPHQRGREDSRVRKGCGLGPGGEVAGMSGLPRSGEVRLSAPSC